MSDIIVMAFLSTCPGRGTTPVEDEVVYKEPFLSTCPGRGTTNRRRRKPTRFTHFYPRAPGGARLCSASNRHSSLIFLSTCPGRGTTRDALSAQPQLYISIHVPREGHDKALIMLDSLAGYFYPRAPGGARLRGQCIRLELWRHFYPRAPGGARPRCPTWRRAN